MGSANFDSAFDAESRLRLVRISGTWDIAVLFATAWRDPTVFHLAECVSILDLRGLDVAASAGEVEE